jgi:tyrosinase
MSHSQEKSPAAPRVRVRKSIYELQREYEAGNKQPLLDLMRAFKGMKELDHTEQYSFFKLGSYHGLPYPEGLKGTGYCFHGNVLFPLWHRAQLMEMDRALQSILGSDSDIAMPYWDLLENAKEGVDIPWAFTRNMNFDLDGDGFAETPNPLLSYRLPIRLEDNTIQSVNNSKHMGYQVRRYPLRGKVGNPTDIADTIRHNAQFTEAQLVPLLNENVRSVMVDKDADLGVASRIRQSLDAPNYTVFSNTTSANAWNNNTNNSHAQAMSLESPHNTMHTSIGTYGRLRMASEILGYGDMGDQDTSGFDPIFFPLHCYIDLLFWEWQKSHKSTKHLEIIPGYPGTKPGSLDPDPNDLTIDTHLRPFRLPGGDLCTGRHLIDISNLGYEYGPGAHTNLYVTYPTVYTPARILRITGINRTHYTGSFVVNAVTTIDGKEVLLGSEAVFSRTNVASCPNCQSHLEVPFTFPLPATGPLSGLTKDDVRVVLQTHEGVIDTTPNPGNGRRTFSSDLAPPVVTIQTV